MRAANVILFFLSASLLVSCTESVEDGGGKVDNAKMEAMYLEFENAFKPINLPFAVPALHEGTAEGSISPEIIEAFFGQRTFSSAFGEVKDVPDLAENLENSQFYALGMLEGVEFNAYIIRKSNNSDYYYLCTLDSYGSFVDGLCIAFSEGNAANLTERIASINEDRSIQIVQRELVSGQQRSELTQFYELNAEGRIIDLEMMPQTAEY